ncbi:Nucleic acid-binding protein [Glarea lozoyensis ATCC 20868]|uniref:DNA-directed RNA polymerases I, II, and III subunit RPABC3 n=1 Tax=Glarea lozoyensis (strain ATCC 20868 / MF5171) TaxID=1116229 RepID=S3DB38_GLAL2|nr:Nucleic acid-binding protein [Glarea lozoyensis ATCC 20868]EPE34955.1 Nucleic acid-binding protein [Glarea lozoyensis ATCC 20868]
MATAGDTQLFDENIEINGLDDKKYDRVCRLSGTSLDGSIAIKLDINSQIYPCAVGDQIRVVLATSLSLDGSKDDGKGWRDIARSDAESTMADMFDYVCHGKIYKFEDVENGDSIKCFISFGGLLMAIEGPFKKLTSLRVDYVYLLMKK